MRRVIPLPCRTADSRNDGFSVGREQSRQAVEGVPPGSRTERLRRYPRVLLQGGEGSARRPEERPLPANAERPHGADAEVVASRSQVRDQGQGAQGYGRACFSPSSCTRRKKPNRALKGIEPFERQVEFVREDFIWKISAPPVGGQTASLVEMGAVKMFAGIALALAALIFLGKKVLG